MGPKPQFIFFPYAQIKGIIILSLTLTILTVPQNIFSQDFQIGAYFNKQTRTNQAYYKRFEEIGMNMIMQNASDATKSFVSEYNLLADNADAANDYIMHYSTAWYSKWEAEENQQEWDKVGIKHKFGKEAIYNGVRCWSTIGVTAPASSLVYGPHYHQEKLYKRWYYDLKKRYNLKYTPRFHMALDTKSYIDPDEEICKLYVMVRHVPVINNLVAKDKVDHILKGPIVLKASDFKPYGTFKDFYLIDGTNTDWYQYPAEYRDSYDKELSDGPEIYYIDRYGDQGIQFCVDWLGKDNKSTLYIDYIEVYDNDGWNDYLENPKYVDSLVTTYAQKYSKWPNLKYWLGHDEPSSLDAYTPIKIVDDMIQSAYDGAPSLINNFFPYWELTVNNDSQLVRYYNTVKPEKLFIDFFPFLSGWSSARVEDWDCLRKILQICSSLQPGFYYQAQAHGYWQGDHWLIWRRPNKNELIAQVMLALAHGVKGLTFFSFDSYNAGSYILQGIIDINMNHTDLSNVLRYNIVPRLKGKLGKTLMRLDYTGDYINMEYHGGIANNQIENDYLSMQHHKESYFWHTGFFNQRDFPDNKYFLLTNLRTTMPVTAKMTVTNKTDFKNVSFTDIEKGVGSVDTTIGISSFITYFETMPEGEGRLYRVSPVIKYGGRLLYSEETKDGMELTDDLIIENGAILTINGNYHSKANIIVKNGRVLYKNNGKIHIAENKRLITK